MPLYSYFCRHCDEYFWVSKGMKDSGRIERCPDCKNTAIRQYDAKISGTRDGFGINKSFRDVNTGREITTWKEWERAGYKDLKETLQGMPDKRGNKDFIMQRVKEKEDRIKHKDGKKFNIGVNNG